MRDLRCDIREKCVTTIDETHSHTLRITTHSPTHPPTHPIHHHSPTHRPTLSITTHPIHIHHHLPCHPCSPPSLPFPSLPQCVRGGGPQLCAAALSEARHLVTAHPGDPHRATTAALIIRDINSEIALSEFAAGPPLPAEKKRTLLLGLSASMGDLLPFLVQVLETHFTCWKQQDSKASTSGGGGGTSEVHQQQQQAEAHENVLVQTLLCVSELCDWVPATMIATSGMVDALGVLVRTTYLVI